MKCFSEIILEEDSLGCQERPCNLDGSSDGCIDV